MDQNKMLNRVRALLAQAEDPAASPAEAEAFSRKAEDLIARYSIDTALIEAKAEVKGKPTSKRFEADRPYPKPKIVLANGIAKGLGMRLVAASNSSYFHVFGYQSDIEWFEVLYTSLLLQGSRDSQHGDRSYRTSFWYGFAGRVSERMKENRKHAEQDAEPGTGLVLRDRESEVADAVSAEFPRLRKSQGGRVGSAAGYNGGRESGGRADLGGTRFSGAKKALA